MKTVRTLLGSLITLAVPFLLLMLAIRMVISPLFVQIEYRMPGFPADAYGFNQQDRLYWSRFAVDYLINRADISYLGDLQFEDGTPLYNERELSHMVDVKNLVQAMIQSLGWLALAFVIAGIFAWRTGWLGDFFHYISHGGMLAIGLVAAILLFVALSFRQLFTNFHRIFFESDTWLFNMSDTLIRLFPLRFWQDAFIAVGALTVLGAVLAIIIGRRLAARLPVS